MKQFIRNVQDGANLAIKSIFSAVPYYVVIFICLYCAIKNDNIYIIPAVLVGIIVIVALGTAFHCRKLRHSFSLLSSTIAGLLATSTIDNHLIALGATIAVSLFFFFWQESIRDFKSITQKDPIPMMIVSSVIVAFSLNIALFRLLLYFKEYSIKIFTILFCCVFVAALVLQIVFSYKNPKHDLNLTTRFIKSKERIATKRDFIDRNIKYLSIDELNSYKSLCSKYEEFEKGRAINLKTCSDIETLRKEYAVFAKNIRSREEQGAQIPSVNQEAAREQ